LKLARDNDIRALSATLFLGGFMRAVVNGILVCAGLLSVAFAANAAPHPLAAPSSFPHETSDLKPENTVRYGVLPNGMRFAILKNDTPRDAVSIRMRFATGSLMEADNQQGLAHFLEHMAFNGSKNVPEGEMVKLLEREGLAFGADTNAYTSWDETVYQLDLPKTAQLGLGLMIMRETSDRLLLDPKAIDKERGVVLSEERARDTPGLRQFKAYSDLVLEGTLPTRRFPIGKVSVLQNAQRAEFESLYRTWYTPDRTFLVVVGAIDPVAAEKEIRTKFADWATPTAPPKPPELGELLVKPGTAAYHREQQGSTSIRLAAVKPYEEKPDTKANRERDLALGLAEAIVNRRLERLARAPDAAFLQASLGHGDYFKTATIAEASAIADPSKWEAALGALEQEVRRALKFGFSTDELTTELKNIRESYATAAAQASTRQTRGLADSLVGAFSDGSVFTSPSDELALFDTLSARLTPETTLSALKEAWGEKAPVVLLGTSLDLKDGAALVQAAYDASRAKPVDAPKQQSKAVWGYTEFGPIGRIASTKTVKDLGLTQAVFANNVRVNFKRTDFEKNRVRVSVRFGQGILDLPAKPGLQGVLESGFLAGGLGKHDSDELERALAGRSVGLSFGVGEDAFVLGGAATPEELPLQMQLLTAFLIDPAWRLDGDQRYRAAKETIYRQSTASTGAVLGTNLPSLLRSGDARFAFPTPSQFDAITLGDARKVLTPALKDGAVEITIVGDVDQKAALNAVAKTFGALPQRAPKSLPKVAERRMKFPLGATPVTLEHKGRSDQTLTALYWPAPDYGDGNQGRQMRILDAIFGVRLTDEIRENKGSTYSPGTNLSASTVSPNFGYLGSEIEVKPTELASTTALIREIARDLGAGKIDGDLFTRARKPLIAEITQSQRNNGWWVSWLSGSFDDPRRLTILRDGRKQYEQATLAQIRALAIKVFGGTEPFSVTVVPGKEATQVETP
jgi:zinc protease